MANSLSEHQRRRTFAIISHPDAGKTTLTEKFLLYGGAIHLAGSVRDRKRASQTSSDWMELEKQRGISVSSTVLQFEYEGFRVNLLDTPGHRDFSEDTYRVLTAVDAAVMVLDVAKGIEDQTRKLFEVCRQRGIPIFTFINKCDRPGKEPLDLLDEVETTLGLKTFAVNWPIGTGPDFSGVYDRLDKKAYWYEKAKGGSQQAVETITSLNDPAFKEKIPIDVQETFFEELSLIDGAGDAFDPAEVLSGELTPVYFGSAVNNFGVRLLLNGFLRHAPPPQARASNCGNIKPEDDPFSAFIFKIQANMDPRHRDRLVFMRVCSGKFHRDLQAIHTQTGKKIRLSFAHQLFGQERETQDEAWPGDILGITGQSGLGIGDTLSEKADLVFTPIPRFAPEAFVYLHNQETKNFKKFRTGLEQLLQEKVVQQFFPLQSAAQIPLLGAVGPLQFDVVRHRLEGEYGAPTRTEPAPWKVTRWIDAKVERTALEGLFLTGAVLAEDEDGNLALLFESEWNWHYFARENPDIPLLTTPPNASLA
ncbi:MAG: peptide chain release factor 3 [Opitutales bacterium]|nr:peptide chain release factor 3 [Opitutales bacterium]